MIVSDYIANYLERRGVTHVFELVGGMITFLLDSLKSHTKIAIVSMHHEQAAGFAAEGYGRMTGLPGIAMATSGPGATNLLTAIGSCYFDSVPAIFITGQVNRHEQKGNLPIRQLGFQETDIVSMAKPITKAAWLVNEPNELPKLLEEAFRLAQNGRPGPVLLDIPMDVQRAELDGGALTTIDHEIQHRGIRNELIPEFLKFLESALLESRQPLLLVGGGVNSARVVNEFREFVEKLRIPVVNSLLAVDALPASHGLRVGLIGSYGNRWANIALSESDLLLVVGSRLDVRQTGADTQSFKGSRKIFHVDCEAGELNNRVSDCITLVSDLKDFLKAANEKMSTREVNPLWLSKINALREKWPDTMELADIGGINPNSFFHRLSAYSEKSYAFVVDVGQHQMWAAQSLDLNPHQRFITSGGMGAMGFALPTGVGTALACGQPVVVIAGDGGFQLNIQELQTIIRNKLPIKIVVLNNQCHGMVRQFQDSYFQGRVQSTVWGYSAPCFSSIAKAYGIESNKVENESKVDESLEQMWEDLTKPYLLEVIIDQKANAYPKMAFGKPISEMEPLAKPVLMEST